VTLTVVTLLFSGLQKKVRKFRLRDAKGGIPFVYMKNSRKNRRL